MDKTLKLYKYVNGVDDTPFPNAEKQIELISFDYNAKRMGGAPTISASFLFDECLDDEWMDNVYVTFNGERYLLKQTPSSSFDNSDCRYKHEAEFVAERIVLDNVYFYDVVTDDTTGDKPVSNSSKVVFHGDIHEFAKRLSYSLEYSNVGYTVVVDEGISSEPKLISFENQFFSNVLQEIYNTYEIPYYFVGKVIHVGFTSNAITETFKYGADNSLLSISKTNANHKTVNRITGVGSADNIPYYYPNAYESKEEVEAYGGTWVNPQTNLMPPIYRESGGAERFYNALNNTYISPETGDYYVFENPFVSGKQKEHIVSFEDIKPTIKGMTNANGLRIDMFSAFAYDEDDNDEFDDEGSYLHPYFFGKLRKFDGEYGFNLFDHSIDEAEMSISMTSGGLGACEFIIGVDEESQKNPVQVDDNGNLKRDEDGNVITSGTPQDRQNDTQNYEVWVALKKDINTFGVIMPNVTNKYYPSTDDTFVILHIDLPQSYITAAENELKEQIIKYMAVHNSEKFTFSIKFSRIFFAENEDILALLDENARLQIEYNGQLHELYVSSFTYKKNGNEPLPEITVELSDTLTVAQNSLQTAISEVKRDIMSSVGSIDWLALGLKYFLRKDQNDKTFHNLTIGKELKVEGESKLEQKVTAKKGIQIGESFIPGILTGSGGFFDEYANGEIESLTIRRELRVPSIVFNQVEVLVGDKWRSPGAGVIERVEPDKNADDTLADTGTFWLKLEKGQIGAVFQHAICMGIFHNFGDPSSNATVDSDDSYGNRTYAGFTTSYFTITEVSNYTDEEDVEYQRKQCRYQIRPTSDRWSGQAHPFEQMNFVCYGIFSDDAEMLKKYGTSVYETRTYTRMLVNQNTWEISANNIGMQYGDMDNLSYHGFKTEGYSIFLNNIYMSGTIDRFTSEGDKVLTAIDKGAWVSGTTYNYYDRVSHNGALWLCINESGTNTEPSSSDSSWLKQVDSGQSVTSGAHWNSANTPYPANTIVNFADKVWISKVETSEPPFPIYTDNSGNRLLFNDGGYILVHPLIQSGDWDLLFDAGDITNGQDGASLYVRYSADGVNWHETFTEGDIYMQQRVGEDEEWSDPIRIVGEEGGAGKDGKYTEYQFAVNDSYTNPPTTGWQDAPPAVGEGQYLWMRMRVVDPSSTDEPVWSAAVRLKGDDGVSTFKSTVFIRQNTQPDTPEGGSYDSPIPTTEGWSDGIPAGDYILWASTRIFTHNGGSLQQSTWSTPQKMTDTANFDVEWSSELSPSAPVGHPNTNPQWSNVSDETTIWMATSNYSNGVWSEWQVSKIKGEKGDGISTFGRWKSGSLIPPLSVVTMGGISFLSKVETENPPLWCYTDNDGNYLTFNDGGYILTGEENSEEYELMVQSGKDGSDGTDYEWIYTRNNTGQTPYIPASKQVDDYIPIDWSDDPVGVTISMQYEFASYRTKKDGLWSAFSKPSLWAKWGLDGETPILADMDNEMDNVALDENGNSIEDTSIQTTISMWYGLDKQTLKSLSVSAHDGITSSIDTSTGTITFTIQKGAAISSRTEIVITAIANINGEDVSRELTFTLAGTKGGANAVLYDIVVSNSSIVRRNDGTHSVNGISATRMKSIAGVSEETTDGTLKYSVDGGSEVEINNNQEINVVGVNSKIQFIFYDNDGVIVDKESVPMIIDGQDGTGINSVTVSYGTSLSADVIPESWSSSLPAVGEGEYLWTRTITDYTDEDREDTVTYTYTYQGKTGEAGSSISIESIQYQSGESATITPTGDWSDTIVEVEQGHYLWTKTVFSDGNIAYGVAHQGVDGMDGASVTMCGDWKTGMLVPKLGAVRMGNNLYVAKIATTNPPLWTYTDSEGNRLTFSDGGYILTGESNTDEYDLSIQSPKDGADGKDYEWIYTRNNTGVIPSAPTSIQSDDYIPSGWTDDPMGVTESIQYEFASVRVKKDGVWGNFSKPAVWAKFGLDGKTPVLADMDNEMDNVALDENGYTTSAFTIQTTVALWYGLEKQTLTNIAVSSVANITTSYDISTGVVTFNIAKGVTLSERSELTITLQTNINGEDVTRELVFTLAAVKAGAKGSDAVLYDIVTSVSSISKRQDGTYSVSTVSATRMKTIGGSSSATTDGTLKYSIDGGSEVTIANNATVATSKITSRIQFIFYNASGVVVDKESIPVIIDGVDGEDGEGFTMCGNWYTGLTVPKMGVVTMGGNCFAAKVATTNPPLWCYTDNSGNRLLYKDGGYVLTGDMNTSEYELWAEKGADGKDGKDGANGADGKQGLQGCIYRQSEWVPGAQYHNDTSLTTTIRYIDIVVTTHDDGSFDVYECKSTHTATSTNKPNSGSSWSTFWTKFDERPPVYTPLLLADNAVMRFGQSNEFIITNNNKVTAGMSGSEEGEKVRIWAGAETPDDASFSVTQEGVTTASKFRTAKSGLRMESMGGLLSVYNNDGIKNIEFGVNAAGMVVMSYYDNDGNLLYDLGPEGIAKADVSEAKWVEVYLRSLGTDTATILTNKTYKSKVYSSSYKVYRYKSKVVLGVVVNPDYDGVYFTNKTSDPATATKLADGYYQAMPASAASNNTFLQMLIDTYDGRVLTSSDLPNLNDSNETVYATDPVYFERLSKLTGGKDTGTYITAYWNG